VAVHWQSRRPGQQPIEVRRFAIRDLLKKIFQVGKRMQAILLGGLDDAIDDGARFCPLVVAARVL